MIASRRDASVRVGRMAVGLLFGAEIRTCEPWRGSKRHFSVLVPALAWVRFKHVFVGHNAPRMIRGALRHLDSALNQKVLP